MADESPEARLEKRLDRIETLLVSRVELTMSVGHLQDQIRDLKDEIKSLRTEQTSKVTSKAQAIYNLAAQVIGGIILVAIAAWVANKGAH